MGRGGWGPCERLSRKRIQLGDIVSWSGSFAHDVTDHGIGRQAGSLFKDEVTGCRLSRAGEALPVFKEKRRVDPSEEGRVSCNYPRCVRISVC